MEWRKLKDLIILILLVVNGFLLVLVWARRDESVSYERSALERTVQVLENSGIEVDLSACAPADGLPPLSVERDVEREADVWTLDTGDDRVLAIGRYYEGQKIVGVFNFTPEDRTVTFPWDPGEFTDLLTGGKYVLEGLRIPAYGCYYMEQEQSRTSAEAEPADA